jgi:beta-fructofuranosidase
MRHHVALTITFMALGCGGGNTNVPCADGSVECVAADVYVSPADADASPPDAGGERDAMRPSVAVPVMTGAYQRVYRPQGARYLNDHTLVRGPDGVWHVYGITHESQGMPHAERSFLHATSLALEGPWADQPDILMTTGSESVLWAPYVFEREPGRWTMFYWGGTPDNRIQRADSTDLVHWTRIPMTATGGRDPFALRVGDRWYLYSVGASASAHGQILVSTSTDLFMWTTPTVAIEDPVPVFGWGNLESPVLVPYDGAYYLFLTRTTTAQIDYARTLVFRSSSLTRFAWEPLTELRGHASEVFLYDGRWYITSAGWTSSVGEENRGLSIAPLEWLRRE